MWSFGSGCRSRRRGCCGCLYRLRARAECASWGVCACSATRTATCWCRSVRAALAGRRSCVGLWSWRTATVCLICSRCRRLRCDWFVRRVFACGGVPRQRWMASQFESQALGFVYGRYLIFCLCTRTATLWYNVPFFLGVWVTGCWPARSWRGIAASVCCVAGYSGFDAWRAELLAGCVSHVGDSLCESVPEWCLRGGFIGFLRYSSFWPDLRAWFAAARAAWAAARIAWGASWCERGCG